MMSCLTALSHTWKSHIYELMIPREDVKALTVIVVVTQIVCSLAIKFLKLPFIGEYKLLIIRIAKTIYRIWVLKWIVIFLLSSFIINIYLSYINANLSIGWSFAPLALIPLYCWWIWNKKRRERYLTGIRGIAKLLSVTVQQVVGYVIYIVVYETSLFFRFVDYFSIEYPAHPRYPGMYVFSYLGDNYEATVFLLGFTLILFLYCKGIAWAFENRNEEGK